MQPTPSSILALGPDWQALYAAATTRDQRALVEAIAARALAAGGIGASVDAVPELATDSEIGPLSAFLESLSRRRQPAGDDAYERHKARTAQRQRDKSAAGRDIGPLPPVADPERRAACERDLLQFLELYFPNIFKLPSGPTQRTMAQRIQAACLLGGLFAVAVPRGCGKTVICIRALLWSQLYRHHRYGMILGATDAAGLRAMLAIKRELRTNPQLAADFPEACYPIYRLDGINQRAAGQLLDGEPTYIEWTDSRIILPTVHGVAGCIIEAGSLLAAVRGAQYTTTEGEVWRPSFVLVDDFQTRESARSTDQVETRLETIRGDVLGLAGPGEPLACVIPCTIIVAGDGADVLTDREKSPQWRGQREGIVDKLPDNLDLWQDYWEILDRLKTVADDDENILARIRAEATAFYLAHQADMDASCSPTWPARKRDWEASSVQHAMNLLWEVGEAAWHAEFMNAPLDPFAAEDEFLSADQIARLFSGYNRGVVPADCQFVTVGIDVQKRCLYWLAIAWETCFTGYVIDYGCYPEQKRATWKASKAEHTLTKVYPGRSNEAALYAGLRDLHNELLTRAWTRTDNQTLHVNLALTDAGDQTTTVRKAVRESDHAARLLPSFGQRIGPERRAISTYEPKTGERIGEEWLIRPGRGRTGRHVRMDIGHWKTFVQRRLATPAGARGSLTLFGRQNSRPHTFLARHLTSETRKRVVGVRPVDLWDLKPGESENHWLDCAVMAAVAASICGAQITGPVTTGQSKTRGRKRTAEYFTL